MPYTPRYISLAEGFDSITRSFAIFPLENSKSLQKLLSTCFARLDRFVVFGSRCLTVRVTIGINREVCTGPDIAPPHMQSMYYTEHFLLNNCVIHLSRVQLPGLRSHRMTFLQQHSAKIYIWSIRALEPHKAKPYRDYAIRELQSTNALISQKHIGNDQSKPGHPPISLSLSEALLFQSNAQWMYENDWPNLGITLRHVRLWE